ncbi:hypothetical protein HDU98_012226 [Podochytrium sp. JEL0797]|nr:hypothetical protein HDU98_012226 [Podochytrium sp. JEL0797]
MVVFSICDYVLRSDAESFASLSLSSRGLRHHCGVVLFRALKKQRKESVVANASNALTKHIRIANDFFNLALDSPFSKKIDAEDIAFPLSQIDQVDEIIATILRNAEEPATHPPRNLPEISVPFDMVVFFKFTHRRLQKIWNTTTTIAESEFPISLFDPVVSAGDDSGRPRLSLVWPDSYETIGTWTRERAENKRRFLVPFFGIGDHLSPYLLRFHIDCTLESDTFGHVFRESNKDGYLFLGGDEEFIMTELTCVAPGFTQFLEGLLEMEKSVAAGVSECGLW